MPVWFAYVDESYDTERFCLSAILIRHTEWTECFKKVRQHRLQLKTDFGIFMRKEIHARDLVSGHGMISPTPIGKWQRSRIFLGLLELVASLPEVKLFNVCLEVKGTGDPQLTAWDRLVNRIERTMKEFEDRENKIRVGLLAKVRNSHCLNQAELERLESRLIRYKSRAFIIADEGKELEITRAIRKMHVFNPIPSKFGVWEHGEFTKNIITDRILEDPVFKSSHRSYFIQLVDCVAFALLKRETAPTPRVLKYGINKMFDSSGIPNVCYREASRNDPLGIVRK